MKPNIISSILISSLLIQLTLTSEGCFTTYPVKGGDDLSSFNENLDNAILMLKNDSEIKTHTKNLKYFGKDSLLICGDGDIWDNSGRPVKNPTKFEGCIKPDKIDSEKVAGNNYLFWTSDSMKIIIKKENLIRFYSETNDYYWIIKTFDKGYQQIYESEINDINIKVESKTALIVGIGVAAVIAWLLSKTRLVKDGLYR